MRNEIASTLADNWPVDDVVVSCNDCERSLYSPGDVMPGTPGSLADYVVRAIEHHHQLTGHRDIDVDIYPNKPVKEIDVEITVQ